MEHQNKLPIVSVIVPVYNANEYLNECIESLLSQSFDSLEIILIDDGSTDNSLEICRTYEVYDQRVRVIHQENNGPSATRNLGLDEAKGKYVVFCDSDDYYEKKSLQKMVEIMEGYSVDLVIGGYRRVYENNVSNENSLIQFSVGILKSRHELAELYTKPKTNLFGVSIWSKMYRLDIIRKYNIRFPEEIDYEEDCCFNVQYFSHIMTAAVCRDILYNYRQRTVSLSKGYRMESFPFLVNGFLCRKNFLNELEMESELNKLDVIFLMVVISNYKKIFYSSLSYKTRLKEYKKIMYNSEVNRIAKSVKPAKKRLTRFLTRATYEKSPQSVEALLLLWNVKQKKRVIIKRFKQRVKSLLHFTRKG